jgi:hypothetical protein
VTADNSADGREGAGRADSADGLTAVGDDYRFLHRPGLDADRLSLYRIAMHLSLLAGPLRLLDGDYPDREPMLRIAEANIGRTLADADCPS